jgi:hypothetical protein
MGHKHPGPSFETPRKSAAPQDDGVRVEIPDAAINLEAADKSVLQSEKRRHA